MQVISDFLGRVEIGPAQRHENLTVFPLFGGSGRTPDYATLDEAIRGGWFEVGEVSEGGSVPELKVVNRGDRAVLMMDGEELRGAKQNRILNLTILVPAGATLIVPVSCVEQGRWAMQGKAMKSTADTLYYKARMEKARAVSANYRRSSSPMSDQSALWREIAHVAEKVGATSRTGAVQDIYESKSRGMSDYVGAFTPHEGQTGAAFAIGSRPVGFEVFEHADVLGKMLRKIVHSYALDALMARPTKTQPSKEGVIELMAEVAQGQTQQFAAVGTGEDLRISGPGVTGAALLEGGHVVHLCAFRCGDKN